MRRWDVFLATGQEQGRCHYDAGHEDWESRGLGGEGRRRRGSCMDQGHVGASRKKWNLGLIRYRSKTHFCAHFHRKSDRAESFAEFETVVPFGRSSEAREFTRCCPIKFAWVNNHTSNRVSVAADPFGRTMNYRCLCIANGFGQAVNDLTDDVSAKLDGLDDITSHPKSIVNNKRDAIVVGKLC